MMRATLMSTLASTCSHILRWTPLVVKLRYKSCAALIRPAILNANVYQSVAFVHNTSRTYTLFRFMHILFLKTPASHEYEWHRD